MGNKVFKGQEVVVEGSLVGETLIVSRFAYDASLNLEYLGEAKVGSGESASKWFIQRFGYDAILNLISIQTATNRTTVGSTSVSIDATNPNLPIITIHNGDFSEVNSGDHITLTTGLQSISGQPVIKISDTQISIDFLKDCGSPPTVPIVSENAATIVETDFIITLANDATKDYAKKRWANRERYIYQ